MGVAVIKISIEPIESRLLTGSNQLFLVHSPAGIVFITNHRPWLYSSLGPLDSEQTKELGRSRQFGSGPWEWSGLGLDSIQATDREGTSYLVYKRSLRDFPGWGLIYLHDKQAIAQTVQQSLIRVTGPFVLGIIMVIGLTVFLLYRTASKEIQRRMHLEKELRESESKYRSIYHQTPAMLHSIDDDYRLVSVSDYWLEITGYSRQEVIGRKLTDFFTRSPGNWRNRLSCPVFSSGD